MLYQAINLYQEIGDDSTRTDVNVGRVAGIPVVLTHVKALGASVWGYGAAIVQRVERAREEGVQVFADQYPYTASATGLESALLPPWSSAGGRSSSRTA